MTQYCVKTDDDAYVHTTRLEINLRALWSGQGLLKDTRQPAGGAFAAAEAAAGGAGPMQYAGATLWASYVKDKFEVCGHGMGPNMAVRLAQRKAGAAPQPLSLSRVHAAPAHPSSIPL